MRLALYFLCSLVGFAQISSAQDVAADVFNCRFVGTERTIIPETVVAARIVEDGTVLVSDPYTQYFSESVIEAARLRDDDKILVVKWDYTLIYQDINTKVLAKLTIQRKNGKAQFTADAPQYRYRDSVGGKCTMQRGKL